MPPVDQDEVGGEEADQVNELEEDKLTSVSALKPS
jgi:hypothetical protein|tara:strand:+ start:562 stop:666 length:105 start_codon:yes stop_codon:yes gene_type:complete